ncbi:ribbon-helix-helix protein, CopG family [Methanomicrobium sp. W14]|uniref:ribbon-helix-helix protein, CopG family n=1 Tax=Methanomicrobium sp. W14 TaxID=2817839 RepID=UPI001AEB0641|nr:ribbon-helix-helix protein, CopG family [Methanomicrobium sp. W14]
MVKISEKEKVSVRINADYIKILDKLAIENDRDRSGEINHAIKFYLDFAHEACKKGMSAEELHQWLYKEVEELSKKYDRLEEIVEKIADKKS